MKNPARAWRFTGPAAELFSHEQAAIIAMAEGYDVPATFLAAIRIAEDGRAGREFGVLSLRPATSPLDMKDAKVYGRQLRACASSVANNIGRFGDAAFGPDGYLTMAFIQAMAARWAPPNADNDPTHLNENWPRNVARVYLGSALQ